MQSRSILFTGASLGALAVALGAMGAHGLEARLTERGYVDVWETAADYHLAHALALLVLVCLGWSQPNLRLRGVALCWLLGTLIFSGTLYVLAAVGPKWLGAVTPIGGIFLIVGWLLLAWQAWRLKG